MSLNGERVVVIPARRASTRLPEKLLLSESGRPLIAHTIGRCRQARLADRVLVAVDGPELAAAAQAAGAETIFTDAELPSGSDRVWAAVQERKSIEHVVNVQGDEPEIEPAAIDALFEALAQGAEVATLQAPLPEELSPSDPAAVKVVLDLKGDALYFSRAAIPGAKGNRSAPVQLHVGVYAYTRNALERFASRAPTPLERVEGLEQLRFLEHGERLRVLAWPHAFAGIDTRDDYEAFLRRARQRT